MLDTVTRERPMTVPEVAAQLGVTSTTIRRWIATGHLEALRPGRSSSAHYRIERTAVEELLRPIRIHAGGGER